MSKGGGSSKTTTEPWKGAQPYITQSMQMAQRVANSGGPQYYQGQEHLDANPNQLGGYGQLANFDNQVFGAPSPAGGGKGGGVASVPQMQNTGFVGPTMQAQGAQTSKPSFPAGSQPVAGQNNAPQYTGLVGALNQLLAGGPAANLGNATANQFGSQLGAFQGPSQTGMFGFDPTLNVGGFTPQTQGPTQLGNFGFDPTLNVNGFTPQFGQAGGLDATSAFQQMLSGNPDYGAVQSNINAANQRTMDAFNQQVLPGIAGRGIISGSDTGAIKQLASNLPQLAQNLQYNALSALEQERNRALGAQQGAASQVAQGGLNAYGLGLQGAGAQQGANQNLANFGYQQALGQAGQNQLAQQNALQAYGLGLQGAGAQAGLNQDLSQFGYQQALGNANLQGDYRSQLLGLGNLGAGLAGQAGQNLQAGANLWPTVYDQGQQPGQNQLAFGNFQQGINQQQLTDYINQFNQRAAAPQDLATWYSNIANGFGGLGGTSTQRQSQSTGLGDILGGVLGLSLKA